VILNRLFEERAISYQTVFEAGDDIAFGNLSDTNINSKTAFQVNAVFSAVSLIAATISTLPVDCFIRIDGQRRAFRPKPAWVERPDIALPRTAFWNSAIVSLLLDGNLFVRVFANRQGQIANLVVLNPQTVTVNRNGNGTLRFQIEGEEKALTQEEMVFIPDVLRPGTVRGVSRVEALKENMGLALALQNFASTFFGQGTNLNGVIEFPGNLTAEQAANLQSSFDARHRGWRKGHRTGILSGGATFKPTQVDPESSQAIDARRLAVEDIARAFNIPANMLNIPGTTTYASVEQNNLQFITHTLRPIVQKLEDAFSPLMARVPGGETSFIKFNLDGLARADLNSRMSAYSTGLQAGFLTINDVRRLEDLSDIEDPAAFSVRVPLANVNIDAADLVADEKRVKMAQILVLSGYDPAEALAAVGLDPISHTGLASTQLQPVSQINPENPEAVYGVE
jgi:HK97 family phage portal protein